MKRFGNKDLFQAVLWITFVISTIRMFSLLAVSNAHEASQFATTMVIAAGFLAVVYRLDARSAEEPIPKP
jgi:hypothetical protein